MQEGAGISARPSLRIDGHRSSDNAPGNANLSIGAPGASDYKSILFISLTAAHFRRYIKANPYSREFRWQTMN